MRLQALILHGLKRSEQIEVNHNTWELHAGTQTKRW